MGKPKRKTTRSTSGRLDNLFSWRRAILEATADELPPTRAHVLLVLSCHMNDAGDGCWPSQGTLAAETKLSLRAVQEHLRAAQADGWVSRTLAFRNGEVVGTDYAAAIPSTVWERMNRAPEPAPEGDAGGATPTTETTDGGVASAATPPAGGATPPRTTCDTVSQEVRHVSQEVHPNSKGNSSLNASEKEKKNGAPAAAGSLSPAAARPDSGQPDISLSASGNAFRPLPVKPMRVTQEELSQALGDVCRALELPRKAWFAPHEYNWTVLWRACAGDTAELVKVFLLARKLREAAGHQGVTVNYVIRNYDDLRSQVYQPTAKAGDENAAALERLRRGAA